MSPPPKRPPGGLSAAEQMTVDYSHRAPDSQSTQTQAHRPIALGSMIGKYKMYAVLGHGGMGNVYAAKDPLIERDVAIKILPPELVRDPASLQRFLGEARAAGKLNHPHIVTIYEVVQIEGGGYAIVMERVNGGSVQDYLLKKGPPGWRAATRLIGEACKALIAAHEMGLIHRDIKPANLLLTSDGHVKVADFGLAKFDGADATLQTQPGAILGTPAYMSPEQCRGDKIDRRSDLYSLGCTYFAMLTRRPPFEAASSMQVMFAHCSAPVPDPRTLDVDVPQACVDILTKALAKDPSERYETARDFLSDLRTAFGGGTIATSGPIDLLSQIESMPEPIPMPTAPVIRRSDWHGRIVAAAATAIVVLALAFLIMRLNSTKPLEAGVGPPQASSVAPSSASPAASDTDNQASASTALPTSRPASNPAEPSALFAPVDARPVGAVATPTTAVVSHTNASTPSALVPQPQPPSPPRQPAPPQVLWRNDEQLPLTFTNSVNMRLRLIKPQSFIMGDDGLPNAPRHKVTLTQAYYMGTYEVSGGEFRAVMGDQVSGKSPRDDLPAAFISWDDANEFCRRLNERSEEQQAKRVYRLPTEAEWECACRAGTTSRYAFGDTLRISQANFGKSLSIVKPRPMEPGGQLAAPPSAESAPPQPPDDQPDGGAPPGGNGGPGQNRPRQPGQKPNRRPNNLQHPLDPRGRYAPNAWGLFDMEGNVWEWCSDFYSPDFHLKEPQIDPTGPLAGSNHVARGGCWASTAEQCASAYRNGKTDENTDRPIYGFRVICQIRADGSTPR